MDSKYDHFSHDNLIRLYQRTPETTLKPSPRVIFSDIHMGDGGRNDDFLWNSDLVMTVLRDYYAAGNYSLVLNGDIEELQRFSLESIRARWAEVYGLFDGFEKAGRLTRTVGNHDMDLLRLSNHGFTVDHAVRYRYHGNTIFLFHGHQTSVQFEKYNWLVGIGLRYFANPLTIKNTSVAQNSLKRFRTEERVYDFASTHKVLSIIGHTHRPLFESMSKVDTMKFEIERLCRKYPRVSARKQGAIEATIEGLKLELHHIRETEDQSASIGSLYSSNFLVPCMFNSGTTVGKRGITCLELNDGKIALVHWFDEERSQKHLRYANYATEKLPGSRYHRVVIKEDTLDYIFARINLLSD
ncbi:MAG: hypothetical protein E4H09_04655 [Spirochaetales bacterium]|nr:MAG: hypothetical protein E4H09_04655 [Spirochaetales bacterium]